MTDKISAFLVKDGYKEKDFELMQQHVLVSRTSIEHKLKPKLYWLRDLGMSKSQIAQAVAVFPPILGLSIEQNLKPTVQCLLDSGLSGAEVARAVAVFPQIFGYSIEKNLKPKYNVLSSSFGSNATAERFRILKQRNEQTKLASIMPLTEAKRCGT
ncbi:Transcription termination factor MTERF5 [Durusdinium trenchii]|uniref:Chloroplastic (Mitochondrial transcription termination factor 5) (mTERF5) (Protein MTERF DEFECTIVE IN ARABIDOPSIS 1) n=1 Tax=Durusdinium trenchii TaxID=1381693 RepID=A0ABP0LUD7_9DINO